MKKIIFCLAAVLVFIFWQRPVESCGGPFYYPIDEALTPSDDLVRSILEPVDDETGFGNTIYQVLFLYPFQLAKPKWIDPLWQFSYKEGRYVYDPVKKEWGPLVDCEKIKCESPDPVSMEAFEAALRKGSLEDAEREAGAIVTHILNEPAAFAETDTESLARAVEFLELKSALTGISTAILEKYFTLKKEEAGGVWGLVREFAFLSSLPPVLREADRISHLQRSQAADYARDHPASPRIATLRFIALQEARRTGIPDGWKEGIKAKMTPEAWRSLEKLHDDWLVDFAKHPLSDLVRLSKLRLYYLQDNAKESWRILFEMYPRHPLRVLAEMRFLLRHELNPVNLSAAEDPLLEAALLPSIDITPDRWTADWKTAEANITKPWAVNFEERLLQRAALSAGTDHPLPEGFPDQPLNRSQLWGKFRMIALLKSGDLDRALEEADSLKADSAIVIVRAKIHMIRQEWSKLLELKGLSIEAKKYLIRVLLDEKDLRGLLTGSDDKLKKEVALTLAVREAAKGQWAEGAKLLQDTDPVRARMWQEAAALASDKSRDGLLAWARYLRHHDGKLTYSPDTVWYRTIFRRFSSLTVPDKLKKDDVEIDAILRHLTNSEMFFAYQAYAAWLKDAKSGGESPRKVLREADEIYNWLLNWANNYTDAWKIFLDKGPEAAILRNAIRK